MVEQNTDQKKIIIPTAGVVALGVVALVLNATTSSVTPTATETTTPPAPTVVMTLNVHGSVDRAGNGNAGKSDKLLADIVPIVNQYKPYAIGFQEICKTQHKAILSKIKSLGYVATMTYVSQDKGCNDKKNGNDFGNSIFIKAASLDWRGSAALPWGENAVGTVGRGPRRVVCAKGKGSKRLVCVTHLAPSDPDKANQAKVVWNKGNGWLKSKEEVIFTGDFNMNAQSLSGHFPGFSIASNTIDHVAALKTTTLVIVKIVPSSDHPAVIASVAG